MFELILLSALSVGQCEAGVCEVRVEAEVCQPVRNAVRAVVEVRPVRSVAKAIVHRQPVRSVARAVVARQPVRSGVRFFMDRRPVRRVLFASCRRCR